MKLFCFEKHLNPTIDNIGRRMMPFILGILLCIVCLAGTSWALFTATTNSKVQNIQSGRYDVNVTVTDSEENNVLPDAPSTCGGLSYTLAAEQTYTVTLTPTGNVERGYCLIDANGENYYTGNLADANYPLTFTYNSGIDNINVTTATEYDKLLKNKTASHKLVIDEYWGEYSKSNKLKARRNSVTNCVLLLSGDTIGTDLMGRPEEMAWQTLNLSNLTADRNDGEVSAETNCVITLSPKKGYILPETVTLKINETEYCLPAEASKENVSTYDPTTGIVTIPEVLLSDGTQITLTAEALPDQKETTKQEAEVKEPKEATTSNATETKPSENIGPATETSTLETEDTNETKSTEEATGPSMEETTKPTETETEATVPSVTESSDNEATEETEPTLEPET